MRFDPIMKDWTRFNQRESLKRIYLQVKTARQSGIVWTSYRDLMLIAAAQYFI